MQTLAAAPRCGITQGEMSPLEVEKRLDELHAEAERLSATVGLPPELRLQRNEPAGDGFWLTWYWREANDGDDEDGHYLALMSKENGQEWELSEVSLGYTDNLLFKFFEGVTHQMAMRQVPEHADVDRRRDLFAMQEELMSRLKPEWANRTRTRHTQVLRDFPFKDEKR